MAPAFRNRGYMTEALRRVLAFLLLEVRFNRVQGGCLKDNPASGRVMQGVGMLHEKPSGRTTATARARSSPGSLRAATRPC